MNEIAENYIKTYESLNKWVKFLLNFAWAIPTNLYRICQSLKRKDSVGAIIGAILLVCCGCWALAVIDFITIALYDKVYWFDFNDMKMFANGEPTVGDATPAEKAEKKEGEADKID